MLLGDRVGHEADEEGRGPVLHRGVYHIEDLYDLQGQKIHIRNLLLSKREAQRFNWVNVISCLIPSHSWLSAVLMIWELMNINIIILSNTTMYVFFTHLGD